MFNFAEAEARFDDLEKLADSIINHADDYDRERLYRETLDRIVENYTLIATTPPESKPDCVIKLRVTLGKYGFALSGIEDNEETCLRQVLAYLSARVEA